MSSLFLWNFIAPLAIGICVIGVLAWIYMLNDFGIWKLFVQSKHRARSIWSLWLALVIYIGFVSFFYGFAIGVATPHSASLSLSIHVILSFILASFGAVPSYVLADSLVEKYGKVGPKRPPVGKTYVGIGSSHASRGGGRYI